jgi:hypothetical protein
LRGWLVKRRLRELVDDGLVAHEHGRFRLADDLDPELTQAFSWFHFDAPDPAAEEYAGVSPALLR